MKANYIGYAAAIIWITLPVVYLTTARTGASPAQGGP